MSMRDLGLQHWPSQIEKVKQLHSQILVRHGVMLVGPTGGGKTTARSILQRALVLLPSLQIEEDMATPPTAAGGKAHAKRHNLFLVSHFSLLCRCIIHWFLLLFCNGFFLLCFVNF